MLKKNENFNLFQLFYTFLAAKQNHNKPNHKKKKKNENFYRKNRGQWSLRSTLHFLPIGIEARISTLWLACGKMGFGAEDKMIFEAEKKRRKRAGEMGSFYVLKSAVELELFSNL